VLLAVGLLACTPAWDADEWARTRPELSGTELGHLGEATPYVVAVGDELIFFWCRWSGSEPVTVSFPRHAGPGRRALLQRALDAWEEAVPGLAFVEEPSQPRLVLSFDESGPEGARASAPCKLEAPLPREGRLQAELFQADVTLRRSEGDAWGRPVALGDAELLGSALHEIGHALGLQGHARRGNSALSRDVDRVRLAGRRVLEGGALDEPAVRALYALPSGTVIERRPLAAGTTDRLDTALGRVRRVVLIASLGDRATRLWTPASSEVEYWIMDSLELFHRKREFHGYVERDLSRAQPTEGSISRALASRFAAGAASPRVFSTWESQ